MSAARKLPLPARPANDAPGAAVAPELRPFVVAMARLLVADLARRPRTGEGGT